MKLHLTYKHIMTIRVMSLLFLTTAALDAYGIYLDLASRIVLIAVCCVLLHAQWKDASKPKDAKSP